MPITDVFIPRVCECPQIVVKNVQRHNGRMYRFDINRARCIAGGIDVDAAGEETVNEQGPQYAPDLDAIRLIRHMRKICLSFRVTWNITRSDKFLPAVIATFNSGRGRN